MIASRIKTVDKGVEQMRRIKEVLSQHRNARVAIGFFAGAGKYEGADAPEVVEVALWNEFGTKHSPPRPFVGTAMDENASKINAWREEMIENILSKNWTLDKALQTMGFRIKTLIENKIRSNVPPPNALSTQRHKALEGVLPLSAGKGGKVGLNAQLIKSKTLIDTGLMLRSVTFKVYLE